MLGAAGASILVVRGVFALSGLTLATAGVAGEAESRGEEIFQQRCVMCHVSAGTGIPLQQVIAAYPRQRIVNALLDGPMRELAFDLNEEEVDAIADYLKAWDKKNTPD